MSSSWRAPRSKRANSGRLVLATAKLGSNSASVGTISAIASASCTAVVVSRPTLTARSAHSRSIRPTLLPPPMASLALHDTWPRRAGSRGQSAGRIGAPAGLRVGEALALRGQDLRLSERRLIVRQGKTAAAARVLPISSTLAPMLAEHLVRFPAGSTDPLFALGDYRTF
jgi:hypothetical protein